MAGQEGTGEAGDQNQVGLYLNEVGKRSGGARFDLRPTLARVLGAEQAAPKARNQHRIQVQGQSPKP